MSRLNSARSTLGTIIVLFLFAFNPLMLTQTVALTPSCKVNIVGGSPNMYPGQYVSLEANVTGAHTQSINYTWNVDGPIIKDYDDSTYNSTYFTSSLNLDPPTPMSTSDFHKSHITFYWRPNTTDPTRTVSLLVQTPNGTCEDSTDFTVIKNNNDTNLQAEDFYVEKNHQKGLAQDGRPTTQVLSQHQQWHLDIPSTDKLYSKNGDLFFDFHRSYIAHFDAWRKLFGYPIIVAWDPGTSIPVGVEVNHTNRNSSFMPQQLPQWFRNQPGSDGPENRTVFFISTFDGQNQLPSGHPLLGSGLNIQFYYPQNSNDSLYPFRGHTFPICEELDYPKSRYPRVQDALSDFEPDQKLLGCALTLPFHNNVHGILGSGGFDMGGISSSPRDPIFWRFHKFIDSVSVQRFFPPVPTQLRLDAGFSAADSTPPRIVSQNPFRLYPYITSLPIISEKEKGLFGLAGIPALSAEFSEPVTGVKASDFTVNGSPATQVSGIGSGPYVFVGFKYPAIGPINVTLSAGNITDISGNHFDGSSWNYNLVQPNIDKDKDGLEDTIEVNVMRTNPTKQDTDGDNIPDGIESTSKCLNPLVNDAVVMDMSMNLINKTGLDTDKDNKSNLQEYRSNTDPCSTTLQSLHTNLTNMAAIGETPLKVNSVNGTEVSENTTAIPFALIIKRSGSISGATDELQYDSYTKQAVSIVNGSKQIRQISDSDEALAKRVLNDSGFFDSKSFYPAHTGSTDHFEYSVIAISNGKLNAIYWTDSSVDIPDGIKNLPFILAHILGEGNIF